jgi:hypothetical protein
LSAVATLNNQQYLRNLNGMATATKQQTAAMQSSMQSFSRGLQGLAALTGASAAATFAILDLGLLEKAKQGWQAIFDRIRGIAGFRTGGQVSAELDAAALAQRQLDLRFAERNRSRDRFDDFRTGLRGQIENRGLSPDQIRLNEFARTFGNTRIGSGLVTEAQRDIDHIRVLGEAATAAAESLRRVAEAQQENVSAASTFADRVNNLLDINQPRPGFAPGVDNVVSGTAINRGIARLFRGLPGGEDVPLPSALLRGSVEAQSAINTAASQRGNSIADVVQRLEEMVELDRQQVQEGIRLREAIEANPRLRSLLGRSGS